MTLQRKGSGTGRKLGIALFWLLLAYVIGMSSLSIIPSLFFPEFAPRAEGPGLGRCAREIAALDAALMQHVSERLQQDLPPSPGALADWDARLLALQGGCGPLEDARKDLGKLRDALESLIRRYESGPKHKRARIHRALSSLSTSTPGGAEGRHGAATGVPAGVDPAGDLPARGELRSPRAFRLGPLFVAFGNWSHPRRVSEAASTRSRPES